MTIVRCPRCRDEVSVPAKATARALVRCPLCLEQYLLAERWPTHRRHWSSSAAKSHKMPSSNRPRVKASIGFPVECSTRASDPGGRDHAATCRAEHASHAPARKKRPHSRGELRGRRRLGFGSRPFSALVGIPQRSANPRSAAPIARYVPWIVPTAFRWEAGKSNSTNGGTARTTGSATAKRNEE